MWLCNLLVNMVVLITVEQAKMAHAHQPNESMPPLLEHMDETLSSVFERLDHLRHIQKMETLLNKVGHRERVTRVSRRDMGDHYQFTLDYVPSTAMPEVKMFLNTAIRSPRDTLSIQHPGTVIVDVPKNRVSVDISFLFPQDIAFRLTLNTRPSIFTTIEMDIPRVLTTVMPKDRDIEFEPGSQPWFELFHWTEELDDVVEAEKRYSHRFLVMSPTEENGLYEFRSNQRGNPIELQFDEMNADQWRIRINSTLTDPEGLLMLEPEVIFGCPSSPSFSSSPSNCLVTSFHGYLQQLSFRIRHHPAPFPEGSFGFLLPLPGGDIQYDSTDLPARIKYCRVGRRCKLRCEVRGRVGFNSPNVSTGIDRVMPNGDVVATRDLRLPGRSLSMSSLYLKIVLRADSGSVFRCTARSGLREIFRDVELIVVQPPSFIRKLSKVTMFNNGSVETTCAARGVTVPDVSVQEATVGRWDYRDCEGAIVTRLSETETKATVFLARNATTTSFRCKALDNLSGAEAYYMPPFEISFSRKG